MFILKKILNSSTPIPECIRVKIVSDQSFAKGMPICKNSEGKFKNMVSGDTPTYITAEDVNEGEKEDILCYPISPDMIFSAIANDDLRSLTPGSTADLNCCDAGYFCLVAPEPIRHDVIVVSNCGAKSFGDRALIKFNIKN